MRRITSDLLQLSIEDTWAKNERRRQSGWEFLGSTAAYLLFEFLGVDQKVALEHLVTER